MGASEPTFGSEPDLPVEFSFSTLSIHGIEPVLLVFKNIVEKIQCTHPINTIQLLLLSVGHISVTLMQKTIYFNLNFCFLN